MNTDALSTEGGRLCPVCEHGPSDLRIDLGDYRLFECPACGCWSSDALVRGARLSFEPTLYFANADYDRKRWELLFSRLEREGKDVRSVLDVGCGTGAFLQFVRERLPGTWREGIELDPERAAQARTADSTARIHVGDGLTYLRHTDRQFDLITLWDVLEHVVAPARLLVALAERLAPGGCIYVQTIHERSTVPVLGKLVCRLSRGRITYPARRSHEPHHLVFFTRTGLRTMADRANLRIADLWFDRLARCRMDGNPVVIAATSALLALENLLGNGLFVNLILEARPRVR